jgi:hypothetical protein
MSFSSFLFQWKEFVPFIELDILEEPERSTHIIETLGELTRFYHFVLIPARPEMPIIPALDSYERPKETTILSRQHFFLQWRIFRKETKSHQRSLCFVDGLCEAIKNLHENESPNVVNIKYKELYIKLLVATTDKTKRLLAHDSLIISKISKDCLFADSAPSVQASLLQILFNMRSSFDRGCMFICEHPLQHKFEEIIFKSDFPYKREIDFLFKVSEMKDEQQFTARVVKVMRTIIKGMQITNSTDVSVFSIVFFRAVFDLSYVVNKNFFRRKYEPEFRLLSDKITLEMTGLPDEVMEYYLSSDNKDLTVRQIVQKNDSMMEAAKFLTSLSFLNSPLDMLSTIHNVLSMIRDFSNQIVLSDKKSDTVQSFDSIFGLFVVILVGSDLPNVEEIFWFINTFSPCDGLSGQLEYANATSSAVLMQTANIVKLAKAESATN